MNQDIIMQLKENEMKKEDLYQVYNLITLFYNTKKKKESKEY